MKKLLILIGILGCMNGYGQFRKYSNEFLNIGAGARSLGMGNSQVALSNDATSGYWNPAGLADVKQTSISLMHASYFSGIANYDYAAIALPSQNGNRTLGFSLLRFAVDDIPNTLFLVEPDGSLNYNNIQTFSSADYALLVSLGQVLKAPENKKLKLGGTAKIIYRKVGSFANAWGFGLDAGLQYATKSWKLGAAVRNLSTTYNVWTFHFTDREKQALYLTQNEIPLKSSEITAPRLILGAAKTVDFSPKFSLTASLDADFSFDGRRNTLFGAGPVSVDPHFGVEAAISNAFFIRAGVTNFQQGLKDGDTTNLKKVWIYQPSLGAGFNIQKVRLDYAFTNLANQSNPLYSHILSLKVDLGK